MKKRLYFIAGIIALISIQLNANAQENSNKDGQLNGLHVTIRMNHLVSSHNTIFNGGSMIAGNHVSRSVIIGCGVEYAYTAIHNDNNSDLTHVKIMPAFADLQWLLKKSSRIVPFLRYSMGISYVSYTKKELKTMREPYQVKESGLYMLSAFGCSFHIHRYLTPFIETGFKGFHMSLNQYDVNPHGIFVNFGITFE